MNEVDVQRQMKNAIRLQNWRDASDLFNEIIEAAGLTSEDETKRQLDLGRRTALSLNAKEAGTSFEGSPRGKKV